MSLSDVMTFLKQILQGLGMYQWIVMALVLGVGLSVVRSVLSAVRR